MRMTPCGGGACILMVAGSLLAKTALAADCHVPAAGLGIGAQLIDGSTGDRGLAANLALFGRWDLAPCLAIPLEAELRGGWVSLGPDFLGGTEAVDVSTLVIHLGAWVAGRLELWRSNGLKTGLRAGLGALTRATHVSIEVQGEGSSSYEIRFIGAAALAAFLRLGRLELALRGAWAAPRADGPSIYLEAAFVF